MTDTQTSVEWKQLRWLAILIVALGGVTQLTRILQVESNTGEVPFHSANDRSRWCTIAALTVNGSYEIDDVLEIRDPETKRRTWYSIDLVRHRGADGKQHFYSSKPPLLPTMYSWVYRVVRVVTQSTLTSDTFFVARVMLVIVNLLPWLAFSALLVLWLGKQIENTWGVVVFSLVVAMGTYLSTFASTLNNHLPGAFAVGVSLWCLDRIVLKEDARWRWFVLCGLGTSFGAANELPALGWVVAAGCVLLFSNPSKTLLGYVPSLLPVAGAFFYFNFAAHGTLVPAYAHRSAGELLCTVNNATVEADRETVLSAMKESGIELSSDVNLRNARTADTWELIDNASQVQYALVALGEDIEVRKWGDWYDYPGSYWTSDRKQGVDKGEPDRGAYIFHCLIGHHGIFSLTPFWFVAIVGCWAIFQQRESINPFSDQKMMLMLVLVATSVVVLGFYFARGIEDRNYGGVCSGFRWSFWLIPLWCWLAAQGLRAVKKPVSKRVVELLVVLSVFSASYPWANPWTSPWPMQLLDYAGWL